MTLSTLQFNNASSSARIRIAIRTIRARGAGMASARSIRINRTIAAPTATRNRFMCRSRSITNPANRSESACFSRLSFGAREHLPC